MEKCEVAKHRSYLSGNIALNELPVYLTFLNIRRNKLSGEILLSALPPKLEVFIAERNNFEGCICLSGLPPVLQQLNLNNNLLHGPVCLEGLPASLTHLDLHNNRFEGIIDLVPILGDKWKGDAPLEISLYDNMFQSYLMPPSVHALPENVLFDTPMSPHLFLMG